MYHIQVSPEAVNDLQQAADWYNLRGEGLGERFFKQAKSQIDALKTNALIYAIRYDEVR